MIADRVVAIVEMTVEVQIGNWGPEAMVEKLVKTSEKEAKQKLQVALQKSGDIRIIGANAVRVVAVAKRDD